MHAGQFKRPGHVPAADGGRDRLLRARPLASEVSSAVEHPGFFAKAGPFTLAEVAKATGAEVTAEAERRVDGMRPLLEAAPSQLSFFENRKYLPQLSRRAPGACLVSPQFVDRMPQDTVALVTKHPYRAFAAGAGALLSGGDPAQGGRSRAWTIASIPRPCSRTAPEIEPGAVIGPEARIGRGTRIAARRRDRLPGHHRARLATSARSTSVTHALVGDRVILHAGVRIGQDGFGFAMGRGGHLKVPQIGRVIIQDDVEIGANSTVDRGALKDTIIGEGTKIDNLVQIGHNVVIGRHCVIVGQVGISGSTELGDFVVMGGQSGAVGHIKIGNGAQIAGGSHPKDDVPAGCRTGGYAGSSVQAVGSRGAAITRLAREGQLAANDEDGWYIAGPI